jgi:hypothetical protein
MVDTMDRWNTLLAKVTEVLGLNRDEAMAFIETTVANELLFLSQEPEQKTDDRG